MTSQKDASVLLAAVAIGQMALVLLPLGRVEGVQRVAGGQLVDPGFHGSSVASARSSRSPREPRKHPALDRTERYPEPFGQLGLGVAAVVGELERLALHVRQLPESTLNPLPLEAEPGRILRRDACRPRDTRRVERLGAPALLAAHEIDGTPVHERQDPGARLRPLGPEGRRRAPDAHERLLDGVLREAVVAQDAEGEPVGDPADALVELCQRRLVAARDERDEGLVREMSEVLAHRPGTPRVGQRYHG